MCCPLIRDESALHIWCQGSGNKNDGNWQVAFIPNCYVILPEGGIPGLFGMEGSTVVKANDYLLGKGSTHKMHTGVNDLGMGIKFPNHAKEVAPRAFLGATGSYTLNDGLETIGTAAFFNNNLSSIEIPSSVKKIDRSAFYGCGDLNAITFRGDTEIGSKAFGNIKPGCTIFGIENVSINHIAEDAFENSDELKFVLESDNEEYVQFIESIGGTVFNHNASNN